MPLLVACVYLFAYLSRATGDIPTVVITQQCHRKVAVTFDDLPATHSNLEAMQYITTSLLDRLKANSIPAIGFVNESKLYDDGMVDERRVKFLEMWLDAGMELGNHTFSHVSIDRTPIETYKKDVVLGETETKELLAKRGKTLKFFRHPQLRTGPTPEYKQELDQFLESRGYTVAPVTIDHNEYIFADVYSRAKQRGDRDTMKKVADSYLLYMEEIFAFYEKLSVDSLGYEVKQSLLLHANELNADYFDGLITMLRGRGYTFISLDEALDDPAYSLPDVQVKKGLSWLHRWMLAKGEMMRPEPREPEFVRQLLSEYR